MRDLRGCHVAKNVVQCLVADQLLEQLGVDGRIDAKQELELDAAVLNIVQENNVVLLSTKLDNRVRISRADIVEHRRVVRSVGRHTLVEDNF